MLKPGNLPAAYAFISLKSFVVIFLPNSIPKSLGSALRLVLFLEIDSEICCKSVNSEANVYEVRDVCCTMVKDSKRRMDETSGQKSP